MLRASPVLTDKLLQVFFSKEWLALVEASFRNFLAEAIQHLPLPTLLRFDTDRLQRQSLQKQVDNNILRKADRRCQLLNIRLLKKAQCLQLAAGSSLHHPSKVEHWAPQLSCCHQTQCLLLSQRLIRQAHCCSQAGQQICSLTSSPVLLS